MTPQHPLYLLRLYGNRIGSNLYPLLLKALFISIYTLIEVLSKTPSAFEEFAEDPDLRDVNPTIIYPREVLEEYIG